MTRRTGPRFHDHIVEWKRTSSPLRRSRNLQAARHEDVAIQTVIVGGAVSSRVMSIGGTTFRIAQYHMHNNHPVTGVVSACAMQLCSTCGMGISSGVIPHRFGACISCEGVCVLGAKPT